MLLASISGIRGTLGEKIGHDLTPHDVRAFVSAFASLIATHAGMKRVVIGRDARPSGEWIRREVIDVLTSFGIQVIDLGLATTPTIEYAVPKERAHGGIIISAGHNPIEYNGMKFLNESGEQISASTGKRFLDRYNKSISPLQKAKKKVRVGNVIVKKGYEMHHIHAICRLPLIKKELIKKANFTIAVDGINSVGGVAIPKLLRALGVRDIVEINTKPTGIFAHMPEPVPQNLLELGKVVKRTKADCGIAVDPDADRGVFFDEHGECFGEEYSLVAVADYVLSKKKGTAVSNICSSVALRDVAISRGGKYFSSPVGEANVVKEVKKRKALIGGEGGSGVGVIYPPLHHGRDSLMGVALFLSLLAETKEKVSEVRARLPVYEMAKDKVVFKDQDTMIALMKKVAKLPTSGLVDTRDGVRIDFGDRWVSLRKSNTEPIIRIYTEARTRELAHGLVLEWKKKLLSLV